MNVVNAFRGFRSNQSFVWLCVSQVETNVKLGECLKKVQQENEDYKARMDKHAALSKYVLRGGKRHYAIHDVPAKG